MSSRFLKFSSCFTFTMAIQNNLLDHHSLFLMMMIKNYGLLQFFSDINSFKSFTRFSKTNDDERADS
ncbi:hypothetical protein DERP_001647 [Dermatophagoides pteronyssinus]|uniref:Uncharacterized protein n=1 Tax=Dermatophagoides pteronyssinus TaxID=6956 RepID=A0ABQ8JBT8_DERPT|nr:hypothetical protein DERP_001647 [Dermatophagoides pteronyssinus]